MPLLQRLISKLSVRGLQQTVKWHHGPPAVSKLALALGLLCCSVHLCAVESLSMLKQCYTLDHAQYALWLPVTGCVSLCCVYAG